MAQTPAENFRDAVLCRPPESGSLIPLWELEFHAWEQFGGKALVLGSEFIRLTSREQERALAINAEIITEVSHQLHFSAVTVPGGYWEIAPGHPAYYWLPEEARMKQLQLLSKSIRGNIMLVASCPAVLAMPDAGEYLEFAYTLMERPEEIEVRAMNLLTSGMELASRLIQLGAEALFTASDVADNHGPYFDPRQMDRLILPQLDRWSAHVISEGGLAILHSDGDLSPCLDTIAETRVQALQAIDPTAGMVLHETIKQVQQRLCLCGNIPCGALMTGTPEAVFGITRDTLIASRGLGSLVLGASNALEDSLRKENYLAFLRAWKTYGER